MKKIIILCVICAFYSCASHRFKNEMDFGIKAAEEGLWKEAFFRWQRYLQKGHDTAGIHNNLAVALEGMGKFTEAEAEYQKALKIDPKNEYIDGNYKKFKKNREAESK